MLEKAEICPDCGKALAQGEYDFQCCAACGTGMGFDPKGLGASASPSAPAPAEAVPVAWQRRHLYPTNGAVPQWEPCLATEATDLFSRLPAYEYRPLYLAPPPTDAEAVRWAAHDEVWRLIWQHVPHMPTAFCDAYRALSSQPPATEGWRPDDLVYYENDGCRLKGLFKQMVEGWIEIELADGSLVISRPSRIKPRQPFPAPPARGGEDAE